MHVFITCEQRFVEYNGHLYMDSVTGYDFWRRYLDIFDQATIVARVKPVEILPDTWVRATGERVDYIPMPYYVGPLGFLRTAYAHICAARRVAKKQGAFILRVPGIGGALVWVNLMLFNKKFGLEVLGDPGQCLSYEVWRKWWIVPIQWLAVFLLKLQCRTARAGIAYVNSSTLPERYPAGRSYKKNRIDKKQTGCFYFSDVSIDNIFLQKEGDSFGSMPKRWKLVFVGSLASLYKGQEILLSAFSQCVRRGFDLELTMVGGGGYQAYLMDRACILGLKERVRFLGQMPSQDVYLELYKADLFILPSYTEGMPRAMIEAMACGLPCIGTRTGGIPELLDADVTVPVGDVDALAEKITELLASPEIMKRMSKRNREIAECYREDALRPERMGFYRQVEGEALSNYN